MHLSLLLSDLFGKMDRVDALQFHFIFQLREYACNITHDIHVLFLIYNGYF